MVTQSHSFRRCLVLHRWVLKLHAGSMRIFQAYNQLMITSLWYIWMTTRSWKISRLRFAKIVASFRCTSQLLLPVFRVPHHVPCFILHLRTCVPRHRAWQFDCFPITSGSMHENTLKTCNFWQQQCTSLCEIQRQRCGEIRQWDSFKIFQYEVLPWEGKAWLDIPPRSVKEDSSITIEVGTNWWFQHRLESSKDLPEGRQPSTGMQKGDICFLSQQAFEEFTFRTWYKACWDKKRQFHGTLCFWKFHGTLCFWQTMKLPEQQNLAKTATCD